MGRSDRQGMTRRRAVALGAAAGAATLAGPVLPAWAVPAARSPRSFTLDVPGAAFGTGRRTPVLRAPAAFDLLGLRGAGVLTAGVEVRVRARGGRWSPWTALGAGRDHAPDGTRRGSLAATDPLWTGGAHELQLRARRPVGGLTVHFVAVGRTARKHGARAARRASAAQGGAPAIIPRAAWGGDRVPPRASPDFGSVQLAFVHHTVSANTYGPEDSASIVLSIAKYHRDTNGWNDVGYNFLVDQYGQIFEGRAGGIKQAVVGAQAAGWNSVSTGVATLGTFQEVPFPAAGVEALARLIAWKLTLHGVATTGQVVLPSRGGAQNRWKAGASVTFERISGHRDGCTTECPGTQLYAQLPALRVRAAQLAPAVSAVAERLTITPSAAAVAYGQDAVFGGTLAGVAGAGLAGARVVLQKQGSKGWVTIARTTTAADGSWSARAPWRRGGSVRAVARGSAGDVRSSALTVAMTPLVALRGVPRRVQAGRTLVVAGTVRGAATGRVLVERSRDGARWTRVGVASGPARGGAFRARVGFRRPGLYRLTPQAGPTTAPTSGPSVVLRAVRRAADVTGGRGTTPGSVTSGGAGSTATGTSAGGVAASG